MSLPFSMRELDEKLDSNLCSIVWEQVSAHPHHPVARWSSSLHETLRRRLFLRLWGQLAEGADDYIETAVDTELTEA